MVDYSEVRAAAREAFEQRFEATGLNGYPCRSGYTVSGYGNQGRNIREVLEEAGLTFDMNLCGIFTVSSWPMEQAAIVQAQAKPQVPAPV